MKNCTDCIHAEWKRTGSGRLHPSGYGRCTKEVKLPLLAACMFWSGVHCEVPRLSRGLINRREELKEDCVYWARKI